MQTKLILMLFCCILLGDGTVLSTLARSFVPSWHTKINSYYTYLKVLNFNIFKSPEPIRNVSNVELYFGLF